MQRSTVLPAARPARSLRTVTGVLALVALSACASKAPEDSSTMAEVPYAGADKAHAGAAEADYGAVPEATPDLSMDMDDAEDLAAAPMEAPADAPAMAMSEEAEAAPGRSARPAREKKSADRSRGGKGKTAKMANGAGPMQQSAVAAAPMGGSAIAAPQAPKFERDARNEGYDRIEENEFLAVADKPLSTFSIDVDTASYANARRFIEGGQLPPADAVRIEEFINYFSYDYPQPNGKHPFSVTAEVADCPWNDDARLVHVGLQGKKIANEDIPGRNLVFLLDVSGSMNSPDKLPLLKQAFTMLTSQLDGDDRVSIVVYAGASGVVLPPTAGNDEHTIMEALSRLEAGGSTNGAAGIELAYKLARQNFIDGGINRVVLATDGDFNVGVTGRGELERLIERERRSGVFLSVLGFGTGNVKDSQMEMLADKGNGNYAYIDSVMEARKVLVDEAGSTLVTIAKDVKIQVEFNPALVSSYRLVGYENRRLADRDFNDDTKDAGEIGAGHTVTALYEVIPAGIPGANGSVDPLKYQRTADLTEAAESGEMMHVKLRYKQPAGHKSTLLSFAVRDDERSLAQASDNFRFSAAVAGFGMLLRDSKFVGESSFSDVYQLASGALGRDEHGYRKQFLSLVQRAARAKGETSLAIAR